MSPWTVLGWIAVVVAIVALAAAIPVGIWFLRLQRRAWQRMKEVDREMDAEVERHLRPRGRGRFRL